MEKKEKKRTPTISYSAMNAFKCRLQWFWMYTEGYQPRQKTMSLELGTAIHKALEYYYKNLNAGVEQVKNETTVLADFREYMVQLYKQIQFLKKLIVILHMFLLLQQHHIIFQLHQQFHIH